MPIVDYNKHMGYVDLSDMLKGSYDIDRKSKKWWMRIFLHLLDVSVVNSFLIYKELSIEEITLFDFRCKLVYGLIGCRGLIKSKGTATLETSCPKKKKNFKDKVPKAIRQDQSAHLLIFSSQRRRRCFCSGTAKPHQTQWKCEVCEVPLCLSGN